MYIWPYSKLFDEIFEWLQCKQMLHDLPCDKTINRICRKEKQAFGVFELLEDMRCSSNGCSIMLFVTFTLICDQFISENQLICIPSREGRHSQVTELYASLHSSYWHRPIRKFVSNSVIYDEKVYSFWTTWRTLVYVWRIAHLHRYWMLKGGQVMNSVWPVVFLSFLVTYEKSWWPVYMETAVTIREQPLHPFHP